MRYSIYCGFRPEVRKHAKICVSLRRRGRPNVPAKGGALKVHYSELKNQTQSCAAAHRAYAPRAARNKSSRTTYPQTSSPREDGFCRPGVRLKRQPSPHTPSAAPDSRFSQEALIALRSIDSTIARSRALQSMLRFASIPAWVWKPWRAGAPSRFGNDSSRVDSTQKSCTNLRPI